MKRFACMAFIAFLTAILTACAAPTQTPPTTEPTQTPIPALGLIRPGDKIGEMTLEREESKHFYWLMDSCNFDVNIIQPHSQTVDCTVPELSVVGVGDYWGAEKTKIDSNWEAMSWELSIDDHPLALDEFGWSDISYLGEGGMEVTYRNWNVLLRDLSAGRHMIRSSFTLAVPIDDGWDVYPPGKYEYIANLTVTKKPVYPTVSSTSEPGQHAYTSQKANLDFLLYLPESYGKDPAAKWPLIVYLHDAELRGTNPDFLRNDSLPKRLNTQKDFPFIVLSPLGNGGWDFWSTDEMITPLFTLLEEVRSVYAVDENRIALTGAGMGGNGVWAIGLSHPAYFAALAPFGGYFYPFEVPGNICDLKDVPVWAFHGGNDFMVPAEVEQKLVDALNACGGNARLTVDPYAVIPLEVYVEAELFDWLLSQ